jgi:hypothetical protein
MVDETNKPEGSSPIQEGEDNLIKQIDELEALLAQKKAEAQKQNILPKINVGTDGIPVLVEAVTEEGLNLDNTSEFSKKRNEDELINDIINKIDKEITQDLDELILILKDSIIEEVKTKLLKELNLNKDNLKK